MEKNPGKRTRERLRRSAERRLVQLCNLYKRMRSPGARKVVTYIENGMPWWLTFVTHKGVEPTNNRAERALRESIVVRKIIGTLRNQKGVGIFERLMSVVATWKLRGEDLHAKLAHALG